MSLELIFKIVATALCVAGVLGDGITTIIALSKGDTEANPRLVALKITTPDKLGILTGVVVTAGVVSASLIPHDIGAGLALGLGIGGILQTVKNINLLKSQK